jgi:hypothetical protein
MDSIITDQRAYDDEIAEKTEMRNQELNATLE